VERAKLPQSRPLRVIDLACGKGYLTFATHQFFRARGIEAQVTGVEQRPELVQQNESIARRLEYDGLSFIEGTIANLANGQDVDLLLALHACDTATDEALHFGVQANAQLILTSPCCHKELRPQIVSPPVLEACFRHGILAERQAELLTDGIRALLLEIHGYEANVFEFISHEHTAKNLMISAMKRRRSENRPELRSRLHELFSFFGLREQRLARLLAEL
jgi:SAM-dependent methyltransferase